MSECTGNVVVFDPKEYEKALGRPMTSEERSELAIQIDAMACSRSIEETKANAEGMSE